MKSFKELKRVMQSTGGYGIPKYATALNMHKMADNLKKSPTDHCPSGQRYDDSRDRCAPINEGVWQSYRDRALEEQMETPHPGRIMDFATHTEHSYHGGSEAKRDRDAYARHLRSLGHKVKKSSTPNQILHGTWGNVYHVAYKPNHLKEALTPREQQSHGERLKPEPVTPHSDAIEKIDTDKQVKKFSGQNMKHRAITSSAWIKGIDEAYEVAFNESGPPKHKHPKIDIHHRGIYVASTTWSKNQKHAKAKWLSLHPDHKESDVKTSYGTLKETTETYKVGDRIVPKIGPHKGEMHRVIHVHPTGHLNITPENKGYGRKNRYRLGAAKAHPNDVVKMGTEVHNIKWPQDKKLEEAKFENTYCSQCGKDLGPGDHGCSRCSNHKVVNPWKNSFRMKTIWDLHHADLNKHVKKVLNRKTVQEVFQAAKDKKKGENPFHKKEADKDAKPQKELVDNLPTDGANEPNKDVSAAPPQFGKKEGGEDQKQNNTTAPEKKTGKIVVKGPGPEDKFQPEPIVTTLTALPDNASAKSGSQGVR